MAKKDGTENLGLGNCECTNDNIVSQEDREVKEDVQDDTKIGTQGGSVATGAIPKKRSSEPPNREWAQLQQTSSIINIDLVSEEVNAHKDVMVTGIVARHRDFSGLHVPPPVPLHKRRTASAPKVTLEEKHHSGYPSSLINQQPPIHDSASCQQAENLPPPGGGLREAVSEEDGVNSCQENILMMGQDTNVTATSQSQQLAPGNTSTTLEENDITSIDGLVRNLKKENNTLHENETELVKELFKLKHDLGKRSEELVHVRTQATMARTENELLSERNSALERENEQLKECVTERETEIAANLETIRKVQEENNTLRENETELVKMARTENALLSKRNSALERENEQLKECVTERETEIVANLETIRRVQEMLRWKSEECEHSKEHIFQSDAGYNEAISRMEGLKRENQEVLELLASTRNQVLELQQSHEEFSVEERQRFRLESDRLMEEACLAFNSAVTDRVKILKLNLEKEESKRKREEERNEKLFTENNTLRENETELVKLKELVDQKQTLLDCAVGYLCEPSPSAPLSVAAPVNDNLDNCIKFDDTDFKMMKGAFTVAGFSEILEETENLPSVGCVIRGFTPNHLPIYSLGWNGFIAKTVKKDLDAVRSRVRPGKPTDRAVAKHYGLHAEVQALNSYRGDLRDATAYVTHPPCLDCAKQLIHLGIRRVFYLFWLNGCESSIELFQRRDTTCMAFPHRELILRGISRDFLTENGINRGGTDTDKLPGECPFFLSSKDRKQK